MNDMVTDELEMIGKEEAHGIIEVLPRSDFKCFKCFMWNLCKCKCWLIIDVIIRNARCNSKVYS